MEARSRPSFPWVYLFVGVLAGGIAFKLISDRFPRVNLDESPASVDDAGRVNPKHTGIGMNGHGPKKVHWVGPVGSKLRLDFYKQDPPSPVTELRYHCNPNSSNECWTNDLMESHRGKTYTYRACVTGREGIERCSDDPWVHVDP